jgi:hypothetical protein
VVAAADTGLLAVAGFDDGAATACEGMPTALASVSKRAVK